MKITKVKTWADFDLVNPNFIYNRFDLFCPEGAFEAVKIQHGKDKKVVEYQIASDKAELGLWLTPITEAELEHLLLYIARTHPEVKTVSYKNALVPMGKVKAHNHFKIVFPENGEQMRARVSPKSWSKMRRRNRRAEEKYGKMEILEYTRENIPDEIVNAFFDFKLATRNRTYGMTPAQYLDRYHVTDCYVVKFGDTIGAMHFCCEQCPVVNGENHSYNPELEEYSLGKFIFAYSLVRIAEKGHTEMFLAGGDYEYKTHYGSIEETLYDCTIKLSEMNLAAIEAQKTLMYRLKQYMKGHLPDSVVKFLWEMKQKMKI